jgi:hypothetical protein
MFQNSIILKIKGFLFVLKNVVIRVTFLLCEKYLGFSMNDLCSSDLRLWSVIGWPARGLCLGHMSVVCDRVTYLSSVIR